MIKVTIKDIAREAGLSIGAVSQVLNDRPCRVSAEKRARIHELAQKYNYIANQAARSLVTKKTHMLALILPDIENIFFSSLAKHIEACCREDGYALLIASSNDKSADERELLHRLTARGVDGIFLIASNESFGDSDALLAQLARLPVPYILVDREHSAAVCDKISFDNESGAYRAVSHLIECGHRKIACVASPIHASNGRARLLGYHRAMRDAGLARNDAYVVHGDYHFESGYKAAQELLGQKDVTAAFICNDMMTLGFLKYLFAQGVRVPQDFSIVSYDDALTQYVLGVELSSVAQDVETLGRRAGQMLMERLECATLAPRMVLLAPELRVRGSVGIIG